MEEVVIVLLIITIYMLWSNSMAYNYISCMSNPVPEIFLEEGNDERGQYYNNTEIEPVYRELRIPNIYMS